MIIVKNNSGTHRSHDCLTGCENLLLPQFDWEIKYREVCKENHLNKNCVNWD